MGKDSSFLEYFDGKLCPFFSKSVMSVCFFVLVKGENSGRFIHHSDGVELPVLYELRNVFQDLSGLALHVVHQPLI